jgi:Fe-S-cluster containining protein
MISGKCGLIKGIRMRLCLLSFRPLQCQTLPMQINGDVLDRDCGQCVMSRGEQRIRSMNSYCKGINRAA